MAIKTIVCQYCKGQGKIEIADIEYLQTRRRELRLTLREVAEKLGVTASYINDLEKGTRSGLRGTRQKLMEFYREKK